jgi:hypothetical protein
MSASKPLDPVSEYGRQKARTETQLQAMMRAGAPIGILRLAKIVSPGMALGTLASGQPVFPFCDMVMAPTPGAQGCVLPASAVSPVGAPVVQSEASHLASIGLRGNGNTLILSYRVRTHGRELTLRIGFVAGCIGVGRTDETIGFLC